MMQASVETFLFDSIRQPIVFQGTVGLFALYDEAYLGLTSSVIQNPICGNKSGFWI